MHTQILLGDFGVDVVRKGIKNVHLSVHPPTGKVRISAPSHMSLDSVRVFAISKLAWIKQQQRKLEAQERETPREFLDRESHFVWGRRYLMKVVEENSPPTVEISHARIILRTRRGTDHQKRQAIVENWYRQQLKNVVPGLFAKWEPLMGVSVARFFVQRMKTKWGSCNPQKRTIRLNTDLAKKPRNCLEYIVIHEMVHLLEPTHSARFTALMNRYMPNWQSGRQTLNRLPVRHETWLYLKRWLSYPKT